MSTTEKNRARKLRAKRSRTIRTEIVTKVKRYQFLTEEYQRYCKMWEQFYENYTLLGKNERKLLTKIREEMKQLEEDLNIRIHSVYNYLEADYR